MNPKMLLSFAPLPLDKQNVPQYPIRYLKIYLEHLAEESEDINISSLAI